TTTQLGSTTTIPTDLPPLEPAVVIGQEDGYDALRAVELPELDAALSALAGTAHPVLDAHTQALPDTWSDDLAALGPAERTVAADVDAYVAAHRAELLGGDADAKDGLADLLRATGLVESASALLPDPAPVTVDGGRCLAADLSGTAPRAVVAPAGGCDGSAAQ